jgi:hypothetical protein
VTGVAGPARAGAAELSKKWFFLRPIQQPCLAASMSAKTNASKWITNNCKNQHRSNGTIFFADSAHLNCLLHAQSYSFSIIK